MHRQIQLFNGYKFSFNLNNNTHNLETQRIKHGRAEIWNFRSNVNSGKRSERVRYCVEQEKRNSISPSNHVLFYNINILLTRKSPFNSRFTEKEKALLRATFKNTIILLFVPPKFCISIAFIFSWDHSKSQEKMETMFIQNFGGTNKEYYLIFESGLFIPGAKWNE